MYTRIVWGKVRPGHSVSLWDATEALERDETGEFFRRKVLPALQPFVVNDFAADHCEVRVKEEFVV